MEIYTVLRHVATPTSSINETLLVTPSMVNAKKEFLARREEAYRYAQEKGLLIDSPGDDEFQSFSPDRTQRYDVKIEQHTVKIK